MVIGIFGESCTGKSTLASRLKDELNAEVYSGNDCIRLAKSESIAKKLFCKRLCDAISGDNVIYVISEKEHLSLLPEQAIRILVTADLNTIKERFAQRMRGALPAAVESMLEKKHGCFNDEAHDIHVVSGVSNMEDVCSSVKQLL